MVAKKKHKKKEYVFLRLEQQPYLASAMHLFLKDWDQFVDAVITDGAIYLYEYDHIAYLFIDDTRVFLCKIPPSIIKKEKL